MLIRAVLLLSLFWSSTGCLTFREDGSAVVAPEWLVRIRSEGCELIPYAVMWVALCGDLVQPVRDEWLVGIAEIVLAEDAALDELGLPPLSGHLENTLVRIHDSDESSARLAGQYQGYTQPETKSIDLWLRTDSVMPRTSALAHEFMHLYDHHEFGVKSLDEWYEITRRGRHFLVPIVAEYVMKHGRAVPGQDPLTAMEAIVCGLDFRGGGVVADSGAPDAQ